MANCFTLNRENLSDAQSEIERQLLRLKVEHKDILRAQLLVEEIFLRMVNNADVAQVKIQVVKNFFGNVQIKMSANF